MEGVHRFLARVHRLRGKPVVPTAEAAPAQLKAAAACVKKVTADTEGLRYNTAISAMMEFANTAAKWEALPRGPMEQFVLVLAPYAPHLAEDMWAWLGHPDTLAYEAWPEADEALLVEATVTLPCQVNGKLRGTVELPAEADEAEALAAAQALPGVAKHVEGKVLRKVIYKPGRILNLVVPNK